MAFMSLAFCQRSVLAFSHSANPLETQTGTRGRGCENLGTRFLLSSMELSSRKLIRPQFFVFIDFHDNRILTPGKNIQTWGAKKIISSPKNVLSAELQICQSLKSKKLLWAVFLNKSWWPDKRYRYISSHHPWQTDFTYSLNWVATNQY